MEALQRVQFMVSGSGVGLGHSGLGSGAGSPGAGGAEIGLADCRKSTYQIALDFRPYSRSGNKRRVELCNGCHDTEDGRKDKQGGM